MKKILLLVIFIFVGCRTLSVALPVGAQTMMGDIKAQLDAAGGATGAGYSAPQDPRLTVANIIRVALELLGVIFLILTIYAGVLWMTAGGNDEKVTKAKSLLTHAAVGLVIILSAYSITLMVIKIVLGRWTDYANYQYVEQPLPIQCTGLSCP